MNENEALTLLRVMVKSYSPTRHIPANLSILKSSADLVFEPSAYECAYCGTMFHRPYEAFYDANAHGSECPWALAFVWLETLEPQR